MESSSEEIHNFWFNEAKDSYICSKCCIEVHWLDEYYPPCLTGKVKIKDELN